MRDRYFNERVANEELMTRDYDAWLAELFESHGVCQLFTPRCAPFPERGTLTSTWRVPDGCDYVAISPELAVTRDYMNGVLAMLDEADTLRQALANESCERSRVLEVTHELRAAIEAGHEMTWVGLGEGVVVPTADVAMPLMSLSRNAPRKLESTEDGFWRLNSDATAEQEREWGQFATNRCWVRQADDTRRRFEVVTVNPDGDAYLAKEAEVDLTKVSSDVAMRLIGRCVDLAGSNPWATMAVLFGGSSDPSSDEFPIERVADVVCRCRGRVWDRFETLEAAVAKFYELHPLAGRQMTQRQEAGARSHVRA